MHIISLDIPYPPERGSVIGIFNRIKAFYHAGVEVILHLFYKEFSIPTRLGEYCKSVYLLPRKKMWQLQDLEWPLYIQSRRSEELIKLLAKDDHPVLFEGLHTLYHFFDPVLTHRKKAIRMHNIESQYYDHLAKTHSNPLKKFYYNYESKKSDQIEKKILPKTDVVFAISTADDLYLKSINVNSTVILPFIDNTIEIKQGIGEYALYHGDLSILENEKAVLFLLDNVFNDLEYPIYIAGYKPSVSLLNKVKNKSNVKLVISPKEEVMKHLVCNAQLILAPFSQISGYKMKLLESIRKGRHIIASQNCEAYTEILPVIHLAESPADWKKKIIDISDKEMSVDEIHSRKEIITTHFNAGQNIQKMIDLLF